MSRSRSNSISSMLQLTLFANTKAASNIDAKQSVPNGRLHLELLSTGLMHFLADAKYKEVENLLENNSRYASELLLGKFDITDHARVIKKEQFYKYILWAQDWRMEKIVRKYIDPLIAKAILLDLESTGITYREIERFLSTSSLSEKKKENYLSSLNAYIAAWEEYTTLTKDNPGSNDKKLSELLYQAREAQKCFPAHVAKSMAFPGRTFSAEIDFTLDELPSDYMTIPYYDDIQEKVIDTDKTWFDFTTVTYAPYLIAISENNSCALDLEDKVFPNLEIAISTLEASKALKNSIDKKWGAVREQIVSADQVAEREASAEKLSSASLSM